MAKSVKTKSVKTEPIKVKSVKSLAQEFKDFDFMKHYRRARCPRMKIRLLALHHLAKGMTLRATATATLAKEAAIRCWARRFAEEGLGGLREKSGRGRRQRLPKSFEAAFVADVERLAKERKGGRIIAKDVQQLLLEKYKVSYRLKSVYVLLTRFNFSWVSCRSQHPKRSQEAIDDFKSGFSDAVRGIEKK